jgi:hypothetical protein
MAGPTLMRTGSCPDLSQLDGWFQSREYKIETSRAYDSRRRHFEGGSRRRSTSVLAVPKLLSVVQAIQLGEKGYAKGAWMRKVPKLPTEGANALPSLSRAESGASSRSAQSTHSLVLDDARPLSPLEMPL